MNPQVKIEQIRSLDPNAADVCQQLGACRLEPGEDPLVRRAKEEKVTESFHARHGHSDIDGFVPAQPVEHDGEYIGTKREGAVELHCIVWREGGQWRRLSDWSEQMPQSARRPAEVRFIRRPLPQPGV
jgi:hypothetical protein